MKVHRPRMVTLRPGTVALCGIPLEDTNVERSENPAKVTCLSCTRISRP